MLQRIVVTSDRRDRPNVNCRRISHGSLKCLPSPGLGYAKRLEAIFVKRRIMGREE